MRPALAREPATRPRRRRARLVGRALVVATLLACLPGSAPPLGAFSEDFFDNLRGRLSFSANDGELRAQLSGTLDLEFFSFAPAPPGLYPTRDTSLFSPRLSLFLDAQWGSTLYGFAQARLDRGFDPGDRPLEARLDEMALRYTPWQDGRLSVQAGQFATVVSKWVERHGSWENPFITAPLPYDHPTPVSDRRVPASAAALVYGYDREGDNTYDHLPLIWGPSYASGFSVSSALGRFGLAAEVKNAGLSSRPQAWPITHTGLADPTLSGRVGFSPDPRWTFGLFASRGPYLAAEDAYGLPYRTRSGDHHQIVLGHDTTFAWRHLQIWLEVLGVRFELPRIGPADATAWTLEAKYKTAPRFFTAVRIQRMTFSDVDVHPGLRRPWGRDVWQWDLAATWRLNAHVQSKMQFTLQQIDGREPRSGHTIATRITVRF